MLPLLIGDVCLAVFGLTALAAFLIGVLPRTVSNWGRPGTPGFGSLALLAVVTVAGAYGSFKVIKGERIGFLITVVVATLPVLCLGVAHLLPDGLFHASRRLPGLLDVLFISGFYVYSLVRFLGGPWEGT